MGRKATIQSQKILVSSFERSRPKEVQDNGQVSAYGRDRCDNLNQRITPR
jgi:hypothetical protein